MLCQEKHFLSNPEPFSRPHILGIPTLIKTLAATRRTRIKTSPPF
jgi:hypothetical protein